MTTPDLYRKVLDASIELVAEQGVRAVSFREVARRAGVSHQTPYHHFGDHTGILRAIAREGFAKLASSMDEAARAAGDRPHKALLAAGIAYVRFAQAHVGHFRVMFQSTLVDVHAEQGPLEEADRTYATLVRIATAAHRAGAGRGLPAEAVAHIAWSTVHGLSLLLVEGTLGAKKPPGKEGDDAITRQVVGGLSRLLEPSK